MNKRIDKLIQNIKGESGINLGVFLFILFFQPFPFSNLDFNNGRVYVTGSGAIVLLAMVIIRTLLLLGSVVSLALKRCGAR